MELLEWYNLIFVAPVGLAGLYLVLSATGIGDLTGETDVGADVDHDLDIGADHDVDVGMDHDLDVDMDHDLDVGMDHDVEMDVDHDLDVGADADLDHDLDVGHDVAMGHDLDVDHDVDTSIDHDLEADHDVHVGYDAEAGHGVEHEAHEGVVMHHEPSLLIRALSVLGFGRVPLSILLTCMMVIFGATGLIANGLFADVLPWNPAPAVYFWPSLGLALLASLTLTSNVARAVHRIMPTSETYAQGPEALLGRAGVSVYGITSGHTGPVNAKDEGGTVQQVTGRPIDGDLPKGSRCILVRYHPKGDYYDVTASPL